MPMTPKKRPKAQDLARTFAQFGIVPEREPEAPSLYGPNGEVFSTTPPPPQAVHFTEQRFEHFVVEHAEKGEDIIYHFWPVNDGDKFISGFAKALENGFKATLPPDADVRAEYTSREEAAVMAKHHTEIRLDTEARSAQPDLKWIPRETYFVRVVGGRHWPLADIFLKHRVFVNIEAAIEAAQRG